MSSLQYIKDNLYALKMDYGSPVDLYKRTITNVIQTGKKITTRTKYSIRRGILLPSTVDISAKIVRGFSREMGRYGDAGVELADRILILDNADLPRENRVPINIEQSNWYVIVNHHRYEISSIKRYEFDAGIIMMLKETQGAEVAEIFDLKIKTKLILNQEISEII